MHNEKGLLDPARPVGRKSRTLLFPLILPLCSIAAPGCKSERTPQHQAEAGKADSGHPPPSNRQMANAPVLSADALPAQPSAKNSGAMARQAHPNPGLAHIIENRVKQEKPKMKLTPAQGAAAARYIIEDLPRMEQAGKLSALMPKTTIELLRAVHERNLSQAEAEAISGYLLRLHDSMKMSNPGPFDENTSHVIGREWHEIDYSGEGMNWESQKKFYSRFGITDLKTAENVKKMFEVESRLPYFSRIYKPKGGLPQ